MISTAHTQKKLHSVHFQSWKKNATILLTLFLDTTSLNMENITIRMPKSMLFLLHITSNIQLSNPNSCPNQMKWNLHTLIIQYLLDYLFLKMCDVQFTCRMLLTVYHVKFRKKFKIFKWYNNKRWSLGTMCVIIILVFGWD